MDENNKITQAIQERFSNLPSELQNAIISSAYQQSLFQIGQKHKLTIEQMGALEMETTLVMLGATHPDDYYDQVREALPTIPPEVAKLIVADVNDQILASIREHLRQTYEEEAAEEKAYMDGDLTAADLNNGIGWKQKSTGIIPEKIEPAPRVQAAPSLPVTQVKLNPDVTPTSMVRNIPFSQPLKVTTVGGESKNINSKETNVLEKSGISIQPETIPLNAVSEKINNPEQTLRVDETILERSGINVQQRVVSNSGVGIIPKQNQADMIAGIEHPPKAAPSPFLEAKLSGAFVMPKKDSEYSLKNISKDPATPVADATAPVPKVSGDQYREPIN